MIAHIKAVEALLEPLGYTVHRWTAPVVSAQYVILSTAAHDGDLEDGLVDCGEAFATDLQVKAVAGTPDGVVIMLARIRGVLSPARGEAAVPLDGRHVVTHYVRSEHVPIVDRDVTITGTNRHPAHAVDTYRLVSQPI